MNLFEITQNGDRWECRPIGHWSLFGAGFMLFGAVFCLYISTTFLWHVNDGLGIVVGTVPLLGAILLAWQSSRFWCLRQVPLVIDSSGRVSYDDKELCPSGSVRSVQVVPDPHAESGDCKIVLEQSDGKRVELDDPFFGSITLREPARALAGELARALKVEMIETTA